ncbi:MAG: glycosyltransferase [Candidatus Dormibacteria bacterium]
MTEIARLGERLVARRALAPEDLDAALRLQSVQRVRLGECLVAEGLAAEEDVWEELAAGWQVAVADLAAAGVDRHCATMLDPAAAQRLQAVPFKRAQGMVWIAAVEPTDQEMRAEVTAAVGEPVRWFAAGPTAIRQAQVSLFRDAVLATALTTLKDSPWDASAEEQLTPRQRQVALGLCALAVACLIVWRGVALIALMGGVTVAYALWLAYRTRVIVRGAKVGAGEYVAAAELLGLGDLPVYTVLCPIYREASVLPELLQHLQSLDYPRSKLDVKLLVEEDDQETRDGLAQLRVPPFCEVLLVPTSGPRTKPKACDYGLQFARGEYLVIFDAEDRPEPDQLKKAVAVFRRHAGDEGRPLGCVQARLAYHNASQNWLTGWFALEYLSWFDYFLPGLVSLGLPVPLGGSSNHFPIAALRQVGSWDPFNVTEDADLGVRLHRAGYRTLILDSVTWEEANSEFVNWIKQRSRWSKGYFVTWAVNMRHPVQLWRDIGWSAWLSVQLTLAGTYVTAVLNLGLWSLMVVWVLGQPTAVAALFPPEFYYLALLELLLGNFFFVYVTVWCATESGAFGLTRLALTYPAYWVMMSIAALKASFQLLTNHVYWEKTAHGLTPPSRPGSGLGGGRAAELGGRRQAVPQAAIAAQGSVAAGVGPASPRRHWVAQSTTLVGMAAVVAATWASLAASGSAPVRPGRDTLSTMSPAVAAKGRVLAASARPGLHPMEVRAPRAMGVAPAGSGSGSGSKSRSPSEPAVSPPPSGGSPWPTSSSPPAPAPSGTPAAASATPSPSAPSTSPLPLPSTSPLPLPSTSPLPLPSTSPLPVPTTPPLPVPTTPALPLLAPALVAGVRGLKRPGATTTP